MEMKRALALFLTLAMSVTLFAGCGSNNSSSGSAASAGSASASGSSQTSDEHEPLTLNFSMTATMEEHHGACWQTFADYIHEKCPWITIEIHPSATLYDDSTFVDAIMRGNVEMGVTAPGYIGEYENDAQYSAYVHAIDELHPGFLMIQDYNLNGAGVSPELLVRLFEEVPSYRCLKIETSMPGPKFTTMLEKTDGRLSISGGWSITQYIEGLDRGVHGMVPTGMHEVFCKLDSLYRSGHRSAACKLYQRIQPVIAFSKQDPGISLHFYKRMLWRMGLYATPNVRAKTIEFDRYFQRIADDMIDLYLEVSQEVRAGVYEVRGSAGT